MFRIQHGPFGVRSPFQDLERLRRQMTSLFDALGGSADRPIAARSGVYPPINYGEDEDNLYVSAELPGVPVSDLELSVENDTLTLRGERKISEVDEKINYHRREREAGFFRRVITLPIKIDAEKVTARAKNGVLTITLPKAAEVKPKTIAVQAE